MVNVVAVMQGNQHVDVKQGPHQIRSLNSLLVMLSSLLVTQAVNQFVADQSAACWQRVNAVIGDAFRHMQRCVFYALGVCGVGQAACRLSKRAPRQFADDASQRLFFLPGNFLGGKKHVVCNIEGGSQLFFRMFDVLASHIIW